MNITIAQLASSIDHSILHPSMTDDDLKEQCAIAVKYKVASVCVKPYHVKQAKVLLKETPIAICAVIGFPHGNSTVEVKVYETHQVCTDGATEVDMVINIGKAIQHDWNYISREIKAINDECLKNKAILKVIFENDFITKEEDKIQLCKICSEHKVAFIKTSTGFGFIKDTDQKYFYHGATLSDIKLMRKYAAQEIQIKAAGGIRTLDQAINALEVGATRIGTSSTAEIMEAATIRLGK